MNDFQVQQNAVFHDKLKEVVVGKLIHHFGHEYFNKVVDFCYQEGTKMFPINAIEFEIQHDIKYNHSYPERFGTPKMDWK